MFRKELPTKPIGRINGKDVQFFEIQRSEYHKTVKVAESLYDMSKTFDEDSDDTECVRRGRLCKKTVPSTKISRGSEEGYDYVALTGSDGTMDDVSFILAIYVPTHVTMDLLFRVNRYHEIVASYKPNINKKSIEEELKDSKILPTFQREKELLKVCKSTSLFTRLYCDDSTTTSFVDGVEYTRVRLVEPHLNISYMWDKEALLRFSEPCIVFIDYMWAQDEDVLYEVNHKQYNEYLFFSEFFIDDVVLWSMSSDIYNPIRRRYLSVYYDFLK